MHALHSELFLIFQLKVVETQKYQTFLILQFKLEYEQTPLTNPILVSWKSWSDSAPSSGCPMNKIKLAFINSFYLDEIHRLVNSWKLKKCRVQTYVFQSD